MFSYYNWLESSFDVWTHKQLFKLVLYIVEEPNMLLGNAEQLLGCLGRHRHWTWIENFNLDYGNINYEVIGVKTENINCDQAMFQCIVLCNFSVSSLKYSDNSIAI